jgi:ribosomal protein S27E
MADTSTQRAYRAPCPGCGAPVEFRSAQSAFAVCSFCQSTVVRKGETLARIGKMAELFDDHSPLQLMASGRFEGKAFTLVGRLQYKYDAGTWTEWQVLMDDGATANLAEDNGAYVFSRTTNLQREVPAAEHFRVGGTTSINGKPFSVASNTTVSLISAQGELAHLPTLGVPFPMVELRNADGQVLSIDYGRQPPELSIGSAVVLDALEMQGLKDESAREEKGRQFSCPNCGAPVSVALGASKSIVCGSCSSIIDLTQGVGGELAHALQNDPVQPLIPLGSVGQLMGVHWQVVGFQHRMGHDPQDADEHFGWDEYLLYNRKRGFSFLVDSEEGWSLVKPTTGAPVLAPGGQSATYLGTRYALKYAYQAETTYVAGEFYWQVERGQRTFNRDFESKGNLLSMEESPREVTWSSGSAVASGTVVQAFGLDAKKELLKRDDAAPVSASSALGCLTTIVIIFVIFVLLFLLGRCTRCDPQVEDCSSSSYRSSGGSFGGSSSGGGHK